MTPSICRDRLVPTLAAVLLVACASSKGPQTAPAPATSAASPSAQSAAATSVSSGDIQQTPGDPIEKLLMNRSPGVWVGRASDGSLAVRIRGGSSLMGNNEPLYILDGSPFTPGPEGALTGINPNDIESIKVLKNAAEISMYGARGANGVIIIKTKQGKR
jgi:TonB-dependent SusC/RagA subfamily outer membrane receptor